MLGDSGSPPPVSLRYTGGGDSPVITWGTTFYCGVPTVPGCSGTLEQPARKPSLWLAYLPPYMWAPVAQFPAEAYNEGDRGGSRE